MKCPETVMQIIFFSNFCWTKVHFVRPLIAPILVFVWPSPWVSKPGWFSCTAHSLTCVWWTQMSRLVLHLPFPPIEVLYNIENIKLKLKAKISYTFSGIFDKIPWLFQSVQNSLTEKCFLIFQVFQSMWEPRLHTNPWLFFLWPWPRYSVNTD